MKGGHVSDISVTSIRQGKAATKEKRHQTQPLSTMLTVEIDQCSQIPRLQLEAVVEAEDGRIA